jgi:hypothetical protein
MSYRHPSAIQSRNVQQGYLAGVFLKRMPAGHPSDVKHAPVGHPSSHRATSQPGGTHSHTGQSYTCTPCHTDHSHTCTPMPHRPVTHMYTRVLMFYTDGPCNNSQQASRAALHQPPARPRRADVPGHALDNQLHVLLLWLATFADIAFLVASPARWSL